MTSVDPQLALTFRPLAGQVRDSLMLDRLMAQLAGFFGVLGLLLAGLGLYGVTAYGLSRRRTEIGIRLALGADPDASHALRARARIAACRRRRCRRRRLSLWASRFVAGLLYGLEPHDPATLVATAAMLLSIGIDRRLVARSTRRPDGSGCGASGELRAAGPRVRWSAGPLVREPANREPRTATRDPA